MNKKRTIIYIDGYNLYYGLLKGTTAKWLPARCQLPDAIPVGTHGNFIRRPAAWQ